MENKKIRIANRANVSQCYTSLNLTPNRLAKLTAAARAAGVSRNKFVSQLIDGLPAMAGKEHGQQAQ